MYFTCKRLDCVLKERGGRVKEEFKEKVLLEYSRRKGHEKKPQ